MSKSNQKSTRRDVLKYSVAGAAAAIASAGCASTGAVAALKPGNEAFYTSDGAFSEEAAKEVYYKMMNNFAHLVGDNILFRVCFITLG